MIELKELSMSDCLNEEYVVVLRGSELVINSGESIAIVGYGYQKPNPGRVVT